MAKYDHVGNIYKKRKEPVWPWIVGAIVFFIIIANL